VKLGSTEVLWFITGFWVTIATVGYAATPRSALRLRSVEYGSLLLVVVRAVMIRQGLAARSELDLPLFLLVLALPVLLARWEIWLVRCSAAEFREDLDRGCRGVLLGIKAASPSRIELEVRGHSRSAWVIGLGGTLTLAILPAKGKGKVTLLINWLSKQYPGPFPRPRIRLRRKR
jgi:hypothetical protein